MIHILRDSNDEERHILATLTNVTSQQIHQAIHDVAEACVTANVYDAEGDIESESYLAEVGRRLGSVAERFGFGLGPIQASWSQAELVVGVLFERGATIVDAEIHSI